MLKRFLILSALLSAHSLLCDAEVPSIKDQLNPPKNDISSEESFHIERMKAVLKYNNALKNGDLKTTLELKRKYPNIECAALPLAKDSDYQCKDDNERSRLVENILYTKEQSAIVKQQTLEQQNNKLGWMQKINSNKLLFGLVGAGGAVLGGMVTVGSLLAMSMNQVDVSEKLNSLIANVDTLIEMMKALLERVPEIAS